MWGAAGDLKKHNCSLARDYARSKDRNRKADDFTLGYERECEVAAHCFGDCMLFQIFLDKYRGKW